jgi:hypothetical protein
MPGASIRPSVIKIRTPDFAIKKASAKAHFQSQVIKKQRYKIEIQRYYTLDYP